MDAAMLLSSYQKYEITDILKDIGGLFSRVFLGGAIQRWFFLCSPQYYQDVLHAAIHKSDLPGIHLKEGSRVLFLTRYSGIISPHEFISRP
jgi:hypothetical protein